MRTELKREAVRSYKDRKRLMGIYAVTCCVTGQVWVGQSRNLDTHQNRIWFALRLGSERTTALQETWNTHGPESFRFEVLAQLDDEETAFPDAKLKALLTSWRDRLIAQVV